MRWERHGRFSPIRTSLRAKVTLGVLLPLLLILGGITAVQVAQHETAVFNSAALIAANASRIIKATLRREITAVHFDDPHNLPDTIADSGDFRVIYLLDQNGVVLAAPDGMDVGTQLSNNAPDCMPCHRQEETERPESVIVETDGGERVFRSMIGAVCGNGRR
ncbi:MAG: hypothetical protein GY803_29150 [Chloroflexi bacterium]|nr:hypothetical protein [Chloroflexota bacterium]